MISTYHAYAGRLVADHALREALEPSLRLITPAVAWQLAARVVAAYDGPMDAITWTPSTVTAAVLDLSGELAEHLRGAGRRDRRGGVAGHEVRGAARASRPARLPGAGRARSCSASGSASSCCRWWPPTRAAKAAREVMDYGDQMALAARIADRHPEVGTTERARYQVVLLDEYQDTSHAQLVLLRALFGGGHPVTAVGDPCQSIYGWRGASAGNLRRFATRLPGPRRGAGPDRGCCPPASATPAGSWTPRPRSRQDLRAAAPEVPRLVAPPPRAGRGHGGRARCCQTAAEEADWVADQVAGCSRCRPGSRRTAAAGRMAARIRSARPTSRCSAASAPSSRRCARRSRPGASRSRWSASAGC